MKVTNGEKALDLTGLAVFEGANPQNASAYAYTPNGTRYVICTTTQYSFKPTTNMT